MEIEISNLSIEVAKKLDSGKEIEIILKGKIL